MSEQLRSAPDLPDQEHGEKPRDPNTVGKCQAAEWWQRKASLLDALIYEMGALVQSMTLAPHPYFLKGDGVRAVAEVTHRLTQAVAQCSKARARALIERLELERLMPPKYLFERECAGERAVAAGRGEVYGAEKEAPAGEPTSGGRCAASTTCDEPAQPQGCVPPAEGQPARHAREFL